MESLALPWLCRQPGMLADGSIDFFDVYAATVIWDGGRRIVEVEAASGEPLVGMRLLREHRLQIDVAPAGAVVIEALQGAAP